MRQIHKKKLQSNRLFAHLDQISLSEVYLIFQILAIIALIPPNLSANLFKRLFSLEETLPRLSLVDSDHKFSQIFQLNVCSAVLD